MLKPALFLFLFVSLLFVSGCGGVGSKATEDNFKQIALQAEPAKVVDLVGEPRKKSKHPQFPSIEIWEYNDNSHVTFDSAKVTAVKWNDKMLVEVELPEDD